MGEGYSGQCGGRETLHQNAGIIARAAACVKPPGAPLGT